MMWNAAAALVAGVLWASPATAFWYKNLCHKGHTGQVGFGTSTVMTGAVMTLQPTSTVLSTNFAVAAPTTFSTNFALAAPSNVVYTSTPNWVTTAAPQTQWVLTPSTNTGGGGGGTAVASPACNCPSTPSSDTQVVQLLTQIHQDLVQTNQILSGRAGTPGPRGTVPNIRQPVPPGGTGGGTGTGTGVAAPAEGVAVQPISYSAWADSLLAGAPQPARQAIYDGVKRQLDEDWKAFEALKAKYGVQ
jgi:hypothetical protein